MKYNDRASRNFHMRSSDKGDEYQSDRRILRRIMRRKAKVAMSNTNHPLCKYMTISDKVNIYDEFKYGTNGNWSTLHQTHDFGGTFYEFIEYLKEIGDDRIIKLIQKSRNVEIDKLLK